MTCKRQFFVRLISVVVLLLSAVSLASASAEFVIRKFPKTGISGYVPQGNLIADNSGSLYGTAYQGGAFGNGTVYKLVPPVPPRAAWTQTVLYNFTDGSDGKWPFAGLVFGPTAKLYGTTILGGAFGFGTVFELSPPTTAGGSWSESVIYSFQGGSTDGAYPASELVFERQCNLSCNLYGVTPSGGKFGPYCRNSGCGVVFELTPPKTSGGAWTETVLHYFNGGQGNNPVGALVLDDLGNLYGATNGGGRGGLVYRLHVPAGPGGAWPYKVLYSFSGGSDGAQPASGLTLRGKGVLYGTTPGASQNNVGTVFQLVPPVLSGGAWTENTLYTFSGSDGAVPSARLIFDPAGNIYGTTVGGGGKASFCDNSGQGGTVFQLSPPTSSGGSWTETVLHSFPASDSDGCHPTGGLVFDRSGVLFGVTEYGGIGGNGVVFGVIK